MLFNAQECAGILDGTVTETTRQWKKPQAVVGGRYRTPVGFIVVDAVDVLADGRTRVRFHRDDDTTDARADLAADTDIDVAAITKRLDRMDAASKLGPWTRQTLELIASRPATRAADLADSLGREKDDWKRDVRKLKELGLTLSLDVGYRISPRGAAYLEATR
jgi:hypothetical protein